MILFSRGYFVSNLLAVPKDVVVFVIVFHHIFVNIYIPPGLLLFDLTSSPLTSPRLISSRPCDSPR